MGLKVFGETLLPIYWWRTYADFGNDLLKKVNNWIKMMDKIDGNVNFNEILKIRN